MASMSNFLRNAVLNHVLRNVTYTPAPTLYVALFLSDPTASDIGNEVSGTAYSRKVVTFGAPSNGQIKNNTISEFNVAGSGWGTITHIGIYDASTSGNLLYYGALTQSKVVNAGDQFVIRVNDITINLE